MAHFAHITNGVVDSVIVIETDVIEENGGWFCPTCGENKHLSEWKQTSYNTHEGIHDKGDIPLRKNYAGIGYEYDNARDAFIPPKEAPSFILNEEKCVYEAPKALPKDGKPHEWNESTEQWDEVIFEIQ
jgi:hypothetical protein